MTFTVYGIPQPKGSSRAFVPKGWSRAVVTSANPKLKDWQHLVAAAAQRVAGDPIDGPVVLSLVFGLARPRSLPAKVHAHIKKPDLDKLVRAVKDAITGICYHDDAQVVVLRARKDYCPTPYVTVLCEPERSMSGWAGITVRET